MSISSKTVWEKKLPPFSGLVLVIALLATITTLTSNVVLFSTKAAAGAIPRKVQITNVSDTSFTVTYQTDEPVLGSIRFGKDTTLGSSNLDDRDQLVNKAEPHRLHYVTIKNLTPGSKYLFEIASGGESFKNSSDYFEVITSTPLSPPVAALPPLTGQVVLDDGAIPVEGVVIVSTDGSQTLSAMLKPDGSYEVPISELRTSDFSSRVAVTETTPLHVTIYDPTNETTATILAGQANPAPIMTLSQQYDFSIADDSVTDPLASGSANQSASESANTPSDFPIPEDITSVTSPKITSPTVDQTFNDPQPLFNGKALPSNSVEIIIQSTTEITATVQSDTNGNWEYRPETPLSPGQHNITIKSPDAQGILQSISQAFTVYAEGSQFVEPSISPPAIPTPILAPPTPASASPILEIPTPTFEPTPTVVIPTQAPVPTTDPSLLNGGGTTPNTGSAEWLIAFAGIVFAAGAGALLFFFI